MFNEKDIDDSGMNFFNDLMDKMGMDKKPLNTAEKMKNDLDNIFKTYKRG